MFTAYLRFNWGVVYIQIDMLKRDDSKISSYCTYYSPSAWLITCLSRETYFNNLHFINSCSGVEAWWTFYKHVSECCMMTSISLANFPNKFAKSYPCRLCTAFDSVFLCLWFWKLIVSFILLGYENVFAGIAFLLVSSQRWKQEGIFELLLMVNFFWFNALLLYEFIVTSACVTFRYGLSTNCRLVVSL